MEDLAALLSSLDVSARRKRNWARSPAPFPSTAAPNPAGGKAATRSVAGEALSAAAATLRSNSAALFLSPTNSFPALALRCRDLLPPSSPAAMASIGSSSNIVAGAELLCRLLWLEFLTWMVMLKDPSLFPLLGAAGAGGTGGQESSTQVPIKITQNCFSSWLSTILMAWPAPTPSAASPSTENHGCSTQVRRDMEAKLQKGKGIFSVETHGCSIQLRRDTEARLQKERVYDLFHHLSAPLSDVISLRLLLHFLPHFGVPYLKRGSAEAALISMYTAYFHFCISFLRGAKILGGCSIVDILAMLLECRCKMRKKLSTYISMVYLIIIN